MPQVHHPATRLAARRAKVDAPRIQIDPSLMQASLDDLDDGDGPVPAHWTSGSLAHSLLLDLLRSAPLRFSAAAPCRIEATTLLPHLRC
jgi:hypothetical protein